MAAPIYTVPTIMREALIGAFASAVATHQDRPATPLEHSIHRTAKRGAGVTPRFTGWNITRTPEVKRTQVSKSARRGPR